MLQSFCKLEPGGSGFDQADIIGNRFMAAAG